MDVSFQSFASELYTACSYDPIRDGCTLLRWLDADELTERARNLLSCELPS